MKQRIDIGEKTRDEITQLIRDEKQEFSLFILIGPQDNEQKQSESLQEGGTLNE